MHAHISENEKKFYVTLFEPHVFLLTEQNGIRLVGGSSPSEGRVEVYVDRDWGTVCDIGWDITDATVVCQQLGYEVALSAPGSATFGQGYLDIVVVNAQCIGTEQWLQDCAQISTDGCSHSQDAGVVCSDTDPNNPGEH